MKINIANKMITAEQAKTLSNEYDDENETLTRLDDLISSTAVQGENQLVITKTSYVKGLFSFEEEKLKNLIEGQGFNYTKLNDTIIIDWKSK